MALLDLLVRDDDKRDRLVVPPANVSESAQGVKTGQQAGFHVAGAWTDQLVANRSDRPQCGRPTGIHGVSVPKQQDPCATLPLYTSDQIIAPALLWTPLDREAEPLRSLHQPVL